METRQNPPAQPGKGDRQAVRIKDNPIGIDDIGLPSGIQTEDAGRLEDTRPDPDKTPAKS